MRISDFNNLFVTLLIFIITVVLIAKINYTNGKLEMCTELGKFYTVDNKCLSCEETGRLWINGSCMVPNLGGDISGDLLQFN